MMRHVHSLSWDNDRVQDELITWQIAKDNGNKPIRNGGAKGFKKAIAALEEQGLGKRLQVGTVGVQSVQTMALDTADSGGHGECLPQSQ